MTYAIIVSAIFAVWTTYIVYILIAKDESFLKERIKNTGKKYKTNTKRLLDSVLEVLKPITLYSIRDNKFKSKIKKLLILVGAASGEDDILDFENKRLMVVLIVSIISVFILILCRFNHLAIIGSFFFVYMAYEYPIMKLKKLIKKREKDFNKYFPDAIDLLSVCVEAGLGLDSAIERVGNEFKSFSPTVGYEFSRLSQDVSSGLTRQEALKNLSKRIKSKDLQSFIVLLVQSEKMGTGISQSLAVYCDTLRSRKKQRVEELVQSSSAKMTIPMVLFLLPAMFVVILYPAVIKLIDALKASNF